MPPQPRLSQLRAGAGLALVLLVASACGAPATLKLIYLSGSDPLAVCNGERLTWFFVHIFEAVRFIFFAAVNTQRPLRSTDGSPGGYYFLPATDPALANVWILHLEGGCG